MPELDWKAWGDAVVVWWRRRGRLPVSPASPAPANIHPLQNILHQLTEDLHGTGACTRSAPACPPWRKAKCRRRRVSTGGSSPSGPKGSRRGVRERQRSGFPPLSSPLPPHVSAAGARVGPQSALPSGVSLTTGWGWPHRSGSHTSGVPPAAGAAAGEMLQRGKDRCSITLGSIPLNRKSFYPPVCRARPGAHPRATAHVGCAERCP